MAEPWICPVCGLVNGPMVTDCCRVRDRIATMVWPPCEHPDRDTDCNCTKCGVPLNATIFYISTLPEALQDSQIGPRVFISRLEK